MICVFEITEGPARGRRFWLRADQRMEVGRISTADFSVPTDPHMSRHHLILEGNLASFRVRDVGSVNGTYVNDAKITMAELCNGDRIRAGETTLAVSFIDSHENPHGKDGVTFSAPTTAEYDDDLATVKGCLPTDAKDNPSHGNLSRRWSDDDFLPCDDEFVFVSKPGQAGKPTFVKLFKQLRNEYSLTAVVNLQRLGAVGEGLVEDLEKIGDVVWRSPVMCAVEDHHEQEFQQLLESTFDQDAVILLGSQAALDSSWLSAFASLATRPSILHQIVSEARSGVTEGLLTTLDFAMFPADRYGALMLLQAQAEDREQTQIRNFFSKRA